MAGLSGHQRIWRRREPDKETTDHPGRFDARIPVGPGLCYVIRRANGATQEVLAMQHEYQDGPGDSSKSEFPIREIARKWLASASDTSQRSFVKALSWRILGSIDTTVLALLFTHNLAISAAIGGTEILTKIVLYYVHERVWTRISFGKA